MITNISVADRVVDAFHFLFCRYCVLCDFDRYSDVKYVVSLKGTHFTCVIATDALTVVC